MWLVIREISSNNLTTPNDLCSTSSLKFLAQNQLGFRMYSMKVMRALFFTLLFTLIIIPISQAGSIFPRPQIHPSFKINTTQNRRSCSFTVSIRTSCSSIRYTRDRISLAFGDAYGNQVYAPRLDDPRTGTFERCSTDTFEIYGPCTYQICYLYLYRSGYDGWIPYDVTVYAYNSRPVTFYYNELIPAGTWYGFDNCYGYGAAASAAMK